MKQLVIYYSYTGNTRRYAQKIAQDNNADIYEIHVKKNPSTAMAYVIAATRKKQEVEPITADFTIYERIIVMAPVWGLGPAPAIYNAFELIPPDKEVEFIVVGADAAMRKKVREEVEQTARKNNINLVNFQYKSM
jgi:flavodoxin